MRVQLDTAFRASSSCEVIKKKKKGGDLLQRVTSPVGRNYRLVTKSTFAAEEKKRFAVGFARIAFFCFFVLLCGRTVTQGLPRQCVQAVFCTVYLAA